MAGIVAAILLLGQIEFFWVLQHPFADGGYQELILSNFARLGTLPSPSLLDSFSGEGLRNGLQWSWSGIRIPSAREQEVDSRHSASLAAEQRPVVRPRVRDQPVWQTLFSMER